MNRLFRPSLPVLLATCLLVGGTAGAANSLRFHAAGNRLDVQATDWSLDELLAQIGGETEWEIYVEPDAHHTVTARFRDLPVGEALGRLLGNLNYALLPRQNAPAKLLVFRTSATDATRRVVPAKKPTDKRVPNELLVTLKSGTGADIDALARSLGAKVTGRLDGQNAYRLEFADEAAAQAARDLLASNNLVADVDANYYVDRPVAADGLTAGSAPPFSLKPTVSTDSSRLVIGLVDTGVQSMGADYDAFLLPPLSIDSDFKSKVEALTHGTSMAETILRGLAIGSENSGNGSPVRVLPVDIYGANENTTTFNVAWGISKAIEGGATIINLSLGSPGDTRILQTMIQNASSQGVVFFAAAGNTPTTSPTFPAAYPQVVAVTAGDSRGRVAPYANYGSFVDVYGPGTSIVNINGRSYMVSGTSSATAYMSGTAAGLATKWGKTPAQVEPRIRQTFSFTPPSK